MLVSVQLERFVGTVRTQNAPLKNDKELKRLGRGAHDSRFHSSQEVLLVRWNDNSIVKMCTNHEKVHPITNCTRRDKKGRVQVPQPVVVSSYNRSMGGVDLFDHFVSKYREYFIFLSTSYGSFPNTYPCRIKFRSKKWYWPLFTNTVDAALVNSWLIYQTAFPQETQSDFRPQIVLVDLSRASSKVNGKAEKKQSRSLFYL